MIKRIVKMQFRPDEVDAFLAIFHENAPSIRKSDGCEYVELLRGADDSSTFFTLSIWRDDAALQTYRSSDLFRSTWRATRALFRARAEAWSVKSIEKH